jgi:hypothetical protein
MNLSCSHGPSLYQSYIPFACPSRGSVFPGKHPQPLTSLSNAAKAEKKKKPWDIVDARIPPCHLVPDTL